MHGISVWELCTGLLKAILTSVLQSVGMTKRCKITGESQEQTHSCSLKTWCVGLLASYTFLSNWDVRPRYPFDQDLWLHGFLLPSCFGVVPLAGILPDLQDAGTSHLQQNGALHPIGCSVRLRRGQDWSCRLPYALRVWNGPLAWDAAETVRRRSTAFFLSVQLEDLSAITAFGWYRSGGGKLSFRVEQVLNVGSG